MDAQVIVAMCAAAVTVAAFFIARRDATRSDGADGQWMRDKLDNISENVRSTRDDVREIRHTLENHEGRITTLEVEVAHIAKEQHGAND